MHIKSKNDEIVDISVPAPQISRIDASDISQNHHGWRGSTYTILTTATSDETDSNDCFHCSQYVNNGNVTPKNRNPWTVQKFVRVAYVDERNVCSKFGRYFHGGFLGNVWNITLMRRSSFISSLDQCWVQTSGRTLTINGTKDAEITQGWAFWELETEQEGSNRTQITRQHSRQKNWPGPEPWSTQWLKWSCEAGGGGGLTWRSWSKPHIHSTPN